MSVVNYNQIIEDIASENNFQFNSCSPLTGGDINQVFLLKNGTQDLVLKLNHSEQFPGMFDAEKFGLEKLKSSSTIDVPAVFATGQLCDQSYLLLEYRKPAQAAPDFWEVFGEQLAALHKTSSEAFGLEKDNYIGSLPQYNDKRSTASKFYIEMRLQPQIELAQKKGFRLDVKESFYKNCDLLIPNEAPSLIHGDLWNGNYIINEKGMPCLIDPAVAYAPREMDLGMMKLFGGFHERLFKRYDEVFPLQKGWEDRIALWQLYYLLVHLNIFGAAYRSQVNTIINRYS
ncbi:fructosamine kinase family protein [Christiangramia salexigens]|uniref:Fructosamine kinase n=1 Tax=Christiangramia salexigens TaxID=1913577 RepID=A0A1L3J5E2_9FLAO|nr:fructosamine kinase family protein [Christiangramia salexigens]APG60320.1 fructosamine kinase [Christiangramia salexigens]